MVITSVSNNKIKELSKLNVTKYRKESDIFLVEGIHLVDEAYKSNLLKEIISLEEISNYNVPITIVNKDVMRKLSTLNTIPNIIGVVEKKNDKSVGNKILMLDDIQDPGNLGTIIRSAVAFNIDTIILSPNTVDLYNPKVIRATEGMLFNISIIECDLLKLIPKLKNIGYKIYSTNVTNGNDVKNIDFKDKYAIIMGNEGNGVKDSVSKLCDEYIYIKMNANCESLNVGIATSIILYETTR